MTANPPLFVVDGVILDKTKMDQVEPDDIKSVTVLNANQQPKSMVYWRRME